MSARDLVLTLGRDYRKASAKADAAKGELRAAVRAAAREGSAEADLARLSGISRMTVRRWLGKDGGAA